MRVVGLAAGLLLLAWTAAGGCPTLEPEVVLPQACAEARAAAGPVRWYARAVAALVAARDPACPRARLRATAARHLRRARALVADAAGDGRLDHACVADLQRLVTAARRELRQSRRRLPSP